MHTSHLPPGLTWWWWYVKTPIFLPSLAPLVPRLLYVWRWGWHSPYRLPDHTWTLVYWHTSPWNNNQYNHKTDRHHNIHKLSIFKHTNKHNIHSRCTQEPESLNHQEVTQPVFLSYNGLAYPSNLPKYFLFYTIMVTKLQTIIGTEPLKDSTKQHYTVHVKIK